MAMTSGAPMRRCRPTHPQARGNRAGQDRLTGQPYGDLGLYLVSGIPAPSRQDRPRVIFGSEQPGDQQRLPPAQDGRPRLDLDPVAEPSRDRPIRLAPYLGEPYVQPVHSLGNISAILPAMSSDGGRAPVSALTITVRSNPSSRRTGPDSNSRRPAARAQFLAQPPPRSPRASRSFAMTSVPSCGIAARGRGGWCLSVAPHSSLCSRADTLGSEKTPAHPARGTASRCQPPQPPSRPHRDQPKHPLHALTTYELTYYRRRLENAIAFLGKRTPSPRSGPTCKPPSTA